MSLCQLMPLWMAVSVGTGLIIGAATVVAKQKSERIKTLQSEKTIK